MIKILLKRFICILFATVFMIWNDSVCFAVAELPGTVDIDVPFSLSDFGEFLVNAAQYGHNELDYWGSRVKNKLYALIDEDVCGHNPNSDGRHHFESINTQINGKQGIYYICEYCGKSAGEVLEDVESEYVASLPAQAVNSDGGVIWTPTIDDVIGITVYFDHYNQSAGGFHGPHTLDENNSFSFVGQHSGESCFFSYNAGGFFDFFIGVDRSDAWRNIIVHDISFRVPTLSGTFTVRDDNMMDSGFYYYNISDQTPFYKYWASSTFGCYTDTMVFTPNYPNGAYILADLSKGCNVQGRFYLPSFSVNLQSPYNVSSSSQSDVYNIGTRVASITGNYGIVNSGGTVSQIESQTIVNEGQHTVYNPITNETENFTDWNYDYSTRTYTLTQEGGDTTTVTYGDEYVTYSSGGNTTNIYYLMNPTSDSGNGGGNSGGGDTPANPPHQHQYSSVVTIEPNCTRSGVRTFTCDGCGASYTENIPAVGHAWEVVQDVKTQYDTETGELLQTGYSVYECTVCGQQYRSDNESMPPGIVGQDLQLQEASSNVLSLLPQLKPLYNGYLGMLQETFPYIPDEIMQLLYFGIASCVLIGIWKALRG